jgi:lipopolysaccharide export LptBFGC system permease protein LptF
MNLINRYIIRETVTYFLLSLLSVLCIFIAVDYLGTMDEFIEARDQPVAGVPIRGP